MILPVLSAFLLAAPFESNAQSKKNAPKRSAGGTQRAASTKPANTVNKSTTNRNTTNNVKVDNSKTNVNINVDNSKNVNINNSRNAVVVRPVRPYPRPPYVYGGHRYYAFHPYYYHPYRPFYWGPVWHPWGFFVATMAATAIIITIESQQYHYDQGVYYVATTGGYTVVQAPVGAVVTTIPPESQKVVVNETTYNYYYGGTYYDKTDKGYTVVAPTAGTIVESLPEGGKEEKIGEVTYVKIGETYYQPIQKDGKNMYEVVLIEADTK
jgi:hypothetical protein